MTLEPRTYTILVCAACGKQATVNHERAGDHERSCDHDGELVPVTVLASWDRDPLKYGLDRAGLTIKPQATIVPPPIGTARSKPH